MADSKTIIALVNRKGGTGKTTSSIYISAALSSTGKQVTGIDLDPDASWLKLKSSGNLDYPVLIGDRENLSQQIQNLSGYVVIDTPPNDEAIIYKVCLLADEVIVPLQSSLLDLARFISTINSVAEIEQSRNKPLASVLLTMWRDSYKISKEVEDTLKSTEAPLLQNKIRHLVRYKQDDTPAYLDEYQEVLKELEIL